MTGKPSSSSQLSRRSARKEVLPAESVWFEKGVEMNVSAKLPGFFWNAKRTASFQLFVLKNQGAEGGFQLQPHNFFAFFLRPRNRA